MKCQNNGQTNDGNPGEKYICPKCGAVVILMVLDNASFIPTHHWPESVKTNHYSKSKKE